jgi:hypothetical protein
LEHLRVPRLHLKPHLDAPSVEIVQYSSFWSLELKLISESKGPPEEGLGKFNPILPPLQ